MIKAVITIMLAAMPLICNGVLMQNMVADIQPFTIDITHLPTVYELANELLKYVPSEMSGLPEIFQTTAIDAICIYFGGRELELDGVQRLVDVGVGPESVLTFKPREFSITGEVFYADDAGTVMNVTRRGGKSYLLRVSKMLDIDYGQFAIGQIGVMRQIEQMTRAELKKAGGCHNGALNFLMDVGVRNAHLVSQNYLRRAMTDQNVFDSFDTQFVENTVMVNAEYRENVSSVPEGRGDQSYFVGFNMDRSLGIMLIRII